jgi:hypothetical protein
MAAIPNFNAKNFTDETDVDNPYLTYEPGTIFTYEVRDADGKLTETRTVTVTDETKEFHFGDETVTCIVVIDEVTEGKGNKLVEVAKDYFAQDDNGNVWYFGEDVDNYEKGKLVDHEGSWLAGENGAEPGIVMLADPKKGATYDQENAPDIAEDFATVKSLNATTTLEAFDDKTLDNLIKTLDINPLETDPAGQFLAKENKYYSNETGFNTEVYAETFELDPDSNKYVLAETVELVEVTHSDSALQLALGATAAGELLL